MRPPPGYKERNEGKVCKLQRILYILKQASRQWNIQLKKFLFTRYYEQSKRDYSLFCRRKKDRCCVILV